MIYLKTSIIMVEVFKTNVQNKLQADILSYHIRENFPHYLPSFDLEDCDKVLRVRSLTQHLYASYIISLVADFGFEAQVMP